MSAQHPLHQPTFELATAIESLNAGVIGRDAGGAIVYVNWKLLDWTGYEHDELIGRHVEDLVPEELRELVNHELDAIANGDLRARLTIVKRKDSTTFPVISLPQIFLDPSGGFAGSIAVVVDLGTVQTAKPAGYGPSDVRGSLARVAMELQSISLSTVLPTATGVPLDHPQLTDLSPRETEVLSHLMASFRVPTIAERLHISQHTVRNHLKSIYRKTGVATQSELIRWVSGLGDEG